MVGGYIMSFAAQIRNISYIALTVCCILWASYFAWIAYQVKVPGTILEIHSITLDDNVAKVGDQVSYTVTATKHYNLVPVVSRTLVCDNGQKYTITPDVTGTSPVGENLQSRPSFIIPTGATGTCKLYWQATYPPANKFQEAKNYTYLSEDTIKIQDPCPPKR
jgi:hypothetical protein